MPTTPNRGWTYPAESQNPYFTTIEGLFLAQDTDVQSLVTGKIGNSLVDAKGDLITATADNTPARLAVGSNGRVLTGDSGASSGVAWDWQPWRWAQTTALVINTTTFTGTASADVPAGMLNVAGARLLMEAWGELNVPSSATTLFAAFLAGGSYCGGSSTWAVPVVTATHASWSIRAEVMLDTSLTVVPGSSHAHFGPGASFQAVANQPSYTITLTSTVPLGIQFQWGASGNTLLVMGVTYTVSRPSTWS
jgi:hypothetical protein